MLPESIPQFGGQPLRRLLLDRTTFKSRVLLLILKACDGRKWQRSYKILHLNCSPWIRIPQMQSCLVARHFLIATNLSYFPFPQSFGMRERGGRIFSFSGFGLECLNFSLSLPHTCRAAFGSENCNTPWGWDLFNRYQYKYLKMVLHI